MRVEDLGPPAAALGVAQVHPQQVTGEQRRLLAALAGLDLEDDVAVVVGVARDQQQRSLLGRGSSTASSAGSSAANDASSAASSRAAWSSPAAACQARYVATTGVSSA